MSKTRPRGFRCDNCTSHAGDVAKSFRLDPRNLRPSYRRLCRPCRVRLRYTQVEHTRPVIAGVRRKEGWWE